MLIRLGSPRAPPSNGSVASPSSPPLKSAAGPVTEVLLLAVALVVSVL